MSRYEINHIDRFLQVNNFTNIRRMRNIMPTDIDGLIDYGGKAFIYFEGKKEGKSMEYGQKLALENVVKSHWKANHPSAAILYVHNIPSHEQVMVDKCDVILIFLKTNNNIFKWVDYVKGIYTVQSAIEQFEKIYKIK